MSQLHLLSDVHVPRWIGAHKHKLQDCEVYVFGDASVRAYGAVIYLKSIIDNAFTVRLIFSKARLAPIKKVTLPRLKLLAALVATRLLLYFCEATAYEISRPPCGVIQQTPSFGSTVTRTGGKHLYATALRRY